jgi:hypothetical protein
MAHNYPVRVGRHWVFPDGRRLPVVSGGADGGGDSGADGDEGKGSGKSESKSDDPPGDKLGDGGKAALDAERRARRDSDKRVKELEAKLKEIEDKDKSEVDKLRDELNTVKADRDEHAAKLLRLEVGAAKGLTPAQSKRLVGSTREDLEADADELLEAFKSADDDEGKSSDGRKPPSGKPSPSMRTERDTDEEADETDPRKLAAAIPRQ